MGSDKLDQPTVRVVHRGKRSLAGGCPGGSLGRSRSAGKRGPQRAAVGADRFVLQLVARHNRQLGDKLFQARLEVGRRRHHRRKGGDGRRGRGIVPLHARRQRLQRAKVLEHRRPVKKRQQVKVCR
jgi:hypothetical protein